MLAGEAQVALAYPHQPFQWAVTGGKALLAVAQGTILAAVGAAVASVPTWIGILLVVGAYIAPFTLGVLAFRPELQKDSIAYKGLNTVLLSGFTVAWVALAVTVLSR